MTELRVGAISDLHYGFPTDRDMRTYMEPAINDIISGLNAAEVDIVIGLGDFIEHADTETDIVHLQRLAELLSGLDAPFYAIPGNHDVAHLSGNEVVQHIAAENTAPYDHIDIGGYRCVLLDTTHRNPDLDPVGGLIGEQQREWLDGVMATDLPTYVFSHHLLHTRSLAGNFWFEPYPELAPAADKRTVNRLLARDNMRAVFSAHIHAPGTVIYKSIPHTTLWAMDKFDPEDTFPAHYGVVEIMPEGFSLSSPKQETSYRFD